MYHLSTNNSETMALPFRRLVTAVLLVLTTFAAFPQSSIDKIIEKLEDNPKCETTMYRENRDPKTHKITSFEMVVTFNDEAIAQRIINAFKNERKNANKYIANSNGKDSRTNKLYSITFNNNNGTYSNYSLSSATVKKPATLPSSTPGGTTETVWTLIVKSFDHATEINKRKKKTSIKRTKTSGQTSPITTVIRRTITE